MKGVRPMLSQCVFSFSITLVLLTKYKTQYLCCYAPAPNRWGH